MTSCTWQDSWAACPDDYPHNSGYTSSECLLGASWQYKCCRYTETGNEESIAQSNEDAAASSEAQVGSDCTLTSCTWQDASVACPDDYPHNSGHTTSGCWLGASWQYKCCKYYTETGNEESIAQSNEGVESKTEFKIDAAASSEAQVGSD